MALDTHSTLCSATTVTIGQDKFSSHMIYKQGNISSFDLDLRQKPKQ